MQAALSHYRILEQIGAGGMGVVYRAHDERLDRDVALKVLPSGALADEAARKRFRKEALALSKLNHPNIATVHDFDTQEQTDFLVEELIPGLSLSEMLFSGPLPEREIINLGSQLADGLAAAHEQGVIHRDLKPANIRVTPDARVKILDFGLAKILRPIIASDTEATASFTETQQVSGTLPYMAPEQLLNEKLDARTDIWAAGCVLYEMATGQRPFLGSGTVLTDAILHQPPTPPSKLNHKVNRGLEAVILKCVEKDPALRYASARDITVDMHRLTTGSVTRALAARRRSLALKIAAAVMAIAILGVAAWLVHKRSASESKLIHSIAILPLANLSGDPQQEYFADGMTEALITELSQIQSLKVISRTSVMRLKGTNKSLPQIARELDVDGIIEGSVLHSGNRVRITAQLIYGPSDTHLWAKSYETDLKDVLTLQSEISRAVANEISAKVTPQEQTQLARAPTLNPEAHDLYLKGRYYWNKRTEESLNRSIEYFNQAIAKDPAYAQAYAGLADSYFALGDLAFSAPNEVFPRAKTAAARALELDPGLGEPHATLASIKYRYDRDWVGAGQEFQRAIELNPNYATAHQWYALYLAVLGQKAEAAVEIRKAQQCDPLSLMVQNVAGWVFYYARQYDRAEEQLLKVLELDPNFAPTHWTLGHVYAQNGKFQAAIEEAQKASSLSGGAPRYIAGLACAYARAGKKLEAQKRVEELKELRKRRFVDPMSLAIIYVALGDNDQAFAWLDRAVEDNSAQLIWLKAAPLFDLIRSDPRFNDLLRRVGLAK